MPYRKTRPGTATVPLRRYGGGTEGTIPLQLLLRWRGSHWWCAACPCSCKQSNAKTQVRNDSGCITVGKPQEDAWDHSTFARAGEVLGLRLSYNSAAVGSGQRHRPRWWPSSWNACRCMAATMRAQQKQQEGRSVQLQASGQGRKWGREGRGRGRGGNGGGREGAGLPPISAPDPASARSCLPITFARGLRQGAEPLRSTPPPLPTWGVSEVQPAPHPTHPHIVIYTQNCNLL